MFWGDIFYPLGDQKQPEVIFCCSMAKFICVRFATLRNARTAISILVNHWSTLFGMPEVLLADHGTSSQGKEWGSICDTFSTKLVLAPVKAHYQIGAAERQVGIVKTAFRSLFLLRGNPSSKQEAMSIICASRNVTPLCNYQLSPLSAIAGRNDLIERIVHSIAPNLSHSESEVKNPWLRLKSIYDTRSLLLKLDSQNSLKLAMARNLRSGVTDNYSYAHDQNVSVWMPHLEKWHGGFRFLNDSGGGMR